MMVLPAAAGQGHDRAVEVLVRGAQPLVVVRCGRALAFLHCGPDGGHSFRAAPAADGANFDGPAHGVDVVDIAGFQACHENPAVWVADHQPFARKLGKGFAHSVAGDPKVLGDRGLG